MFLAESGPNNVSRRDGDGLAEAGHKALLRRGETPSNTAREKDGSKLRETFVSTYHETLQTFPRIRELMESSQPGNNVAA